MDPLLDAPLRAFHATAHAGSVRAASLQLGCDAATLLRDLQALESRLRVPLLTRSGDTVRLSRAGQDALRYCDELFAVSRGLSEAMRSHRTGHRTERLRVGIADGVPRVLAHRLLDPARRTPGVTVRLSCAQGRLETLLRQVDAAELDLVLTDGKPPPSDEVPAETLVLGSCGVSLFAAPSLSAHLERRGPDWLERAPFLLPAPGAPLRRDLDTWFDQHGIRPEIAGEFEDSALLKAFAADGAGLFAMHDAAADELEARLGFVRVAGLSGIVQRVFAVVRDDRRDRAPVRALLRAAPRAFEAPAQAAR